MVALSTRQLLHRLFPPSALLSDLPLLPGAKSTCLRTPSTGLPSEHVLRGPPLPGLSPGPRDPHPLLGTPPPESPQGESPGSWRDPSKGCPPTPGRATPTLRLLSLAAPSPP